MSRNPHEVLGIPRGAPQDEVKKAYRRLAKKRNIYSKGMGKRDIYRWEKRHCI